MQHTRVVIEGAITAALFIVLFFLSLFVPLFAIIAIFLWPIPILFHTAKHGVKPSIIVGLVSAILSLLFSNLMIALLAVVTLLTGLVMGGMIRKKTSAFAVLGGGSLAAIVGMIGLYGILAVFFHFDPMQYLIDQTLKMTDIAEKVNPILNSATKEELNMYRDTIKMMATLTPLLLTLSGVFYALITQLIGLPIIKRLGVKIPKWLPFREWRLPRSLIWYYLAVLIIMLFGHVAQGTTLFIVCFNIYQLLEFAMILQGITFIFFLCHSRKMNVSIPIIVSILALFVPFLLYIVRILGIIDLGFDLRTRLRKP
ncbi:YybS family protein [Camelliibacillus cellulosilyticus]|uniref:YybS family protein n=1 Tax=Camelliibacillus cellulosilyticus TaxID=2174486 RepID=A0ABV9GSL3_9BACL